MSEVVEDHVVVNTAGKRCPRPLMDTQTALACAEPGDVITVWATDLHFVVDIQASPAMEDHEIEIEHAPLPEEFATTKTRVGTKAVCAHIRVGENANHGY